MSIAGQLGRAALRTARRTTRGLARPLARAGLTARTVVEGRQLPRRRLHLRDQLTRIEPAGSTPPVRVVATEGRTAVEVEQVIRAATTDRVALVASTTRPLDDRWLARLADLVDGDVVGATALLLHPERPSHRATPDDLLVREAGIDLAEVDGAPRAEAAGASRPPLLADAPRPVDALSAAGTVLDRDAFVAAGGFPTHGDLDAAMVGLSARLRQAGGQLVVVPAAAAFDDRPIASGDPRLALDPEGTAWRDLVTRTGPLLLRSVDGRRPTTFAITIAAPSARVAPRWGDWHLAEGLARALRRRGHPARVQSVADIDDLASRACDVQVVLRGKARAPRSSGQRHVLWVISHPDLLSDDECDEADLVLVASTRFADDLRARTSTPVAALLQATDPDRFSPRRPDPAWSHDVVLVANARHTLRPIVTDALAAGIRPAIVGRGWSGLVDDDLAVAEQVPNDELAIVYSSAGVVLNDHWPDMRAHGFVSNRVFDVLACAAPLVSDELPELAELFGDAVATYRSPDELARVVDRILADPEGARRRASSAREQIVAAHTFDHRADQLLALVDDLVQQASGGSGR